MKTRSNAPGCRIDSTPVLSKREMRVAREQLALDVYLFERGLIPAAKLHQRFRKLVTPTP